jgi:hypothetical protein
MGRRSGTHDAHYGHVVTPLLEMNRVPIVGCHVPIRSNAPTPYAAPRRFSRVGGNR